MMKFDDLLEHGKRLQICDERNIFATVTVSYSFLFRLMRVLMRSHYQSQGSRGFIGVFKDEFVLFDSVTWRGVPGKEDLRILLADIEDVHYKKTLFNIKFKVKTPKKTYKFFVRKRDFDVIEEITKLIVKTT